MHHFRRHSSLFLSVITLLICGSVALISQNTGRRSPARIHDKVDENKLVTLSGNTRSEAHTANDMGSVSDDFGMEHMLLQLKRSAAQEKAAAQFVADLHNPKSSNFHKWMTAADFGKNFGVAESDIETVKAWLQSHGFTVNSVYPNGMTIDFSGQAGQVRRAFHTAIHHLDVDGTPHVANVNDPQIPEALAPVVAGVVSMHDFQPHTMKRAKYTFQSGGFTNQALVPEDLATIYNLNPLFAQGITGTGQTIVVIEDTDLYSSADWDTFRSTFGLSQYSSGSLTTVHPTPADGLNNCSAPGVVAGDDGEAILDAEWASAAAPNAAIVVAACRNTRTTFGGFIAMQNIVNASNPPQIISLSYGNCEAENGASSNAAISALYQQAVAEGISVFVSAGDEGAASCDAQSSSATHGIGVSGYASTPYNVAVGGTDFSDTIDNTNSNYWSATNSANYGSALSYIPEIPWNDSCAGGLLASYLGYSTSYGTGGFCNTSAARKDSLVEVVAGSGGPSNCASGSPSTFGVASGSCQGVAKPEWQTGLAGIPNDGVRDIPDVSLFAADGIWGHYYVTCWSDVRNGGSPCTGAPSTWGGAGGTSFSSPILAGIQALVNQNAGGTQGNPNYKYYALAVSTPSVFHSVTRGDIDVNCTGTQDCFGSSGATTSGRGARGGGSSSTSGALSVSSSSFTPAYSTGSSWNFATGIGSVDAFNLVMNWGH
jgi:subtilase family serine protease